MLDQPSPPAPLAGAGGTRTGAPPDDVGVGDSGFDVRVDRGHRLARRLLLLVALGAGLWLAGLLLHGGRAEAASAPPPSHARVHVHHTGQTALAAAGSHEDRPLAHVLRPVLRSTVHRTVATVTTTAARAITSTRRVVTSTVVSVRHTVHTVVATTRHVIPRITAPVTTVLPRVPHQVSHPHADHEPSAITAARRVAPVPAAAAGAARVPARVARVNIASSPSALGSAVTSPASLSTRAISHKASDRTRAPGSATTPTRPTPPGAPPAPACPAPPAAPSTSAGASSGAPLAAAAAQTPTADRLTGHRVRPAQSPAVDAGSVRPAVSPD